MKPLAYLFFHSDESWRTHPFKTIQKPYNIIKFLPNFKLRLILLVTIVSILSEIIGIYSMFNVSNIYVAFDDNNLSEFYYYIIVSCIYVMLQSLVVSYNTYLCNHLSLQWRCILVEALQNSLSRILTNPFLIEKKNENNFEKLAKYSNALNIYSNNLNDERKSSTSSTTTFTPSITSPLFVSNMSIPLKQSPILSLNSLPSNIDQRITQDIEELTTLSSKIVKNIILLPFIIAFYSYYLTVNINIYIPVLCFIFFIINSLINKKLIVTISPLIYNQSTNENNFRLNMNYFISNLNNIILNYSIKLEFNNVNKYFNVLYYNLIQLYYNEFFLLFSTNAAAYFGSVFCYIIVGLPLLYGAANSFSSSTSLNQSVSSSNSPFFSSFFNFLDNSLLSNKILPGTRVLSDEDSVPTSFPTSAPTSYTSDNKYIYWSRGIYAGLSLINGFTNTLEVFNVYSSILGYYHRINDIFILDAYFMDLVDEKKFFSCKKTKENSIYNNYQKINANDDEEFEEESIEENNNISKVSFSETQSISSLNKLSNSFSLNNIESYSLDTIPLIRLRQFHLYSQDSNYLLLQNINLDIYYKQKILIKGKTGCGKSTLLNYLAFYIYQKNYQYYLNDFVDDKLIKKRQNSIKVGEDIENNGNKEFINSIELICDKLRISYFSQTPYILFKVI